MNEELPYHAEDKLDHALTMLAAGIPADEILAEAGDDADWLQPLLEIAGDVEQLQQSIPLPPPDSSLERMLAHAETVTPASPPTQPGLLATLLSALGLGRPPVATGLKAAALAASLVIAFLAGSLLGGSLSLAAYDSLPGQPLYGLKRTTESLRLGLTFDPDRRKQLLQTYNHRRQMEAQLLLQHGQEQTISFEDVIAKIEDGTIRVDGLTIQITPETQVEGELTAGARVRIEAVTRPPNQLRALVITVLEPGPPTPAPPASPTPTASPAPNQTGDTIELERPAPDDDIPDNAPAEPDDSINEIDGSPELEDADDLDDENDDPEEADEEDDLGDDNENDAGNDDFGDDEDATNDNGDNDFGEDEDDRNENENENENDFDEDPDDFNDNEDEETFDEDDFNDNEDELGNEDDDFEEDDDFDDEDDFDDQDDFVDEDDFDDEDSSDDDNSGSDDSDDNAGSGGGDDGDSDDSDDGDDSDEDDEDDEDD